MDAAWLRDCVALGLGSLGAWQAAAIIAGIRAGHSWHSAYQGASSPHYSAREALVGLCTAHLMSKLLDMIFASLWLGGRRNFTRPSGSLGAEGPGPGPGRGAPALAWDAPRHTQQLHYSSWGAAQWH